MGFGLGAFVYGFVLKAIPSFQLASKNAAAFAAAKTAATKAGTTFDPSAYQLGAPDVSAIMSVFIVSGIVFAIIGGLCATLLKNPPAGYTVAGLSAAATSAQRSFTPAETLRAPQFYLLWLMLFLNVTAGILIISNAVPIIEDLSGALPAVAVPAYGLVAVFNGLGRFFWGAISDRIGRNLAFALIFGVQVVVFVALAQFHNLSLVLGAFAIVLLCYGGGFGTMPSFNADYFGTKYLGQNYGMIITAWGFGGVFGPLIAAKVKDVTGSFTGALVPVAIMLAVATILPFVTKKPADTVVSGSVAPAT